MKATVLAGAFVIAAAVTAAAQCTEWKWPEDKSKAEESVVLIKDNKNNGNFKQAVVPLNWVLTNAPQLNTSIYIYGAEIFDGLAKKEKDATAKQRYVDSLMTIYDLRIQNCGEEASVIQRKALHAAYYNVNVAGKEEEVLGIMDRALELNGPNVMDPLLVPYMQVVRLNKLKIKKLTDDQVLQKYDNVMGILDAKIKKALSEGKPTDKLKKMQEDIDAILPTIVAVDCEFVKKNMEPKYRQNPSDIELAKKIFRFMLQGKCTDDPLWLEAAEKVHNSGTEKDFGLAKVVGVKYLASDNVAKAESYLKEAAELATDPKDKAEVLIYLGGIQAKKGDRSGARELYRQAVAADANNKEAYEKIGDLYYGSFEACANKQSYAEDRLVYLAAYEMYARAGNRSKMAQAQAQFPSTSEIFELNWNEGDSKRVGCWINETVTLKTRGKD
ncbi:MAG: hypothetical protein HC859_11895 [Bacteroidia bacterium]|nr:hypothetical protein [Bacteroidia bacterium]